MKKILMLSLMAALVISVVTALSMLRPEQGDILLADQNNAPSSQEAPAEAVAQRSGTASNQAATESTVTNTDNTAATALAAKGSEPMQPEPVEDEVIDALLSELFADVADAYQQQARYPHFSQPILDAQALQAYRPNGAHQVSLPYPLPNGDTYNARLRLDRYRYTPDDRQQVNFKLSTDNGTPIHQVEAEITNLSGQALHTQPLNLPPSAHLDHEIALTLSSVWQYDWPAELQWRVRARLGQQQLSVVAPFYLEPPIATLTGLGTAVINDGFLDVPLNIRTENPGYYYVQANLFTDDGTPLLHLQAEGPVANGYPGLVLQAFGPALAEANASGPYQLKDIQLTRLGDDDQPDRFGHASQDAFTITAISLTAFEGIDWEDPMLAERLEFLKGSRPTTP